MFFLLSKVLGFFAEPSNLLITVGLAGAMLLRTRFARVGGRLLIAATVLLAVFGLAPAGNALLLPLEQRFPAWDSARGAPDGIVVLGGVADEAVSGARGDVVLNDAAERMTAAVELARRYPRVRILFSGGSNALMFERRPEAVFARRLFEALGIEPGRVVLEDRSRNTVENAVFSRAAANPKPGERWLLVTSAHHMPRAIGAFRRAQFSVEAYPTDWRTRGPADLLFPSRSLSEGLRRADIAAREWVGLLAYWLAGHTSELFPGPLVGAGCDNAAAAEGCRR